jgi:hypothetical protein
VYAESDPVYLAATGGLWAAINARATGAPIYSVAGLATGTPLYVEAGTGTLIAASISTFMPGSVISNEFLRGAAATDLVHGITVTNFDWAAQAASAAIQAGTYGVSNAGWVQLNEQDQEIPPSSVYVTNGALSYMSAASARQTVYTTGNLNPVTVPSGHTNYWRITASFPTSSASFGTWGQMAISTTNLAIYNAATTNWIFFGGIIK